MKKQWRAVLVAAGSAVSSMIVAALLRERNQDQEQQPAKAAPAPGRRGAEPASKRDMAINFLSDLLAETYRKIRSQQDRRHD